MTRSRSTAENSSPESAMISIACLPPSASVMSFLSMLDKISRLSGESSTTSSLLLLSGIAFVSPSDTVKFFFRFAIYNNSSARTTTSLTFSSEQTTYPALMDGFIAGYASKDSFFTLSHMNSMFFSNNPLFVSETTSKNSSPP